MKKILSFVAIAAALFSLASCSGDLHDDVKIDPNAMQGNWFYTVLDVAAATDTISIIFNNNEGLQTANIENVDPTCGSVAYVWGAKTKSDPCDVSTRTDCPDKSSLGGNGKLVVYCFSNSPKVTIWAWEGKTNFTGGSWPGLVMDTDAVIPMVDVAIEGATVSVNGLPEELNDSVLYFTGGFNGWKTPSDEGSIECTVSNGSIVITLPKLETEVEQGAAQEIVVEGKFASADWAVPEIAGSVNSKGDGLDNIKVTITPEKKNIVGTYDSSTLSDKYECSWTVE